MKKISKDECIICYCKDDLIHFPYYFSSCTCIYNIHRKCNNEWLKNNNTCIICRTENKNKNICSLIADILILVFIYEIYIYIHPFNYTIV